MRIPRSFHRTGCGTPATHGGFTLIELMIVVVVIAILAAIAYPSYQEHVVKSRRATAQACLLELGQFMERFYATNMRYDQTTGGAAVALPQTQCGRDLAGFYAFQFADEEPTAGTYEIEAVPQGAQAKGDTLCGTLSVNQRGEKKVGVEGTAVSACWK
ncbi:type IV pilin protein [Caldimonas thermodepolymerans]|jgi:prepilin-type N-terminal cleavage/methylation domain|uniref:type IV pilin protein n=1 Tax=Caldimonas thermodepolymerans TaxID=215580 RepID=UPI0023513FE5|nr:type IV pilin protein [Caldimonas thermodepolymerans]